MKPVKPLTTNERFDPKWVEFFRNSKHLDKFIKGAIERKQELLDYVKSSA